MLLTKNNVEIIRGHAQFIDDSTLLVNGQEIEFEHCIIATGSTPILLKNIELSDNVVDSKGALNFENVPEHLVVVGGGYIGSELASAYRDLGSQVTIVEAAEDILLSFDQEMVALVKKNFKQRKIKLLTSHFVDELIDQQDKVIVKVKNQEEIIDIEADKVLLSIGRRPNSQSLNLETTSIEVDEKGFIITDEFGQTNNSKVYAIGDVTHGLALAHKASYAAKGVVENILGESVNIKDKVIPAIAFVQPECASVGLELKDIGEEHLISKFDYAANGRAMTLNENQGFVRLIADKESEVLVGAQIVGLNASELIGECALAIENKLTVKQVTDTIHAHPTTNEMIMDAAEDLLGLPIHG